jgi:hypothetical protein
MIPAIALKKYMEFHFVNPIEKSIMLFVNHYCKYNDYGLPKSIERPEKRTSLPVDKEQYIIAEDIGTRKPMKNIRVQDETNNERPVARTGRKWYFE